jgi:hypothetical protein
MRSPLILATLVAGAILPLWSSAAAAQATGALTGQVVDSAGRPLENVDILLDGIPRTATSNVGGSFRFDGVPAGAYRLTARLPGFQAADTVVSVTGGTTTAVRFRLLALPQQLDPIDVTGARLRPVLTGWVHDTDGRPLEHVEIILRGMPQTVRTNAQGAFRFDSVGVETYQLTARLPGYAAAQSAVTTQEGRHTEVALRLRLFNQVLETIEVVADRRGLYGVVGTSALRPVAGATVRVHGGGTSQVTDSAGRFAFPGVKTGDYLVAVQAAGMEERTLHVEMPRNGRLEVSITVMPENPSRRPFPGQRWVNHDLGLQLSFQPSWRRMNRGELARYAGRQLCDIARVRREARGTEATIILDGVRALNPWSLCAFNADEVALVTFAGGCRVMGMTVRPPPGMRCIGVWTR